VSKPANWEVDGPVRVSTAFCRLLRLEGVRVRDVWFEPDRVVVWVALRRRRLVCPLCEFSTPHRHDIRPVDSVWRHLDLGVWRLELRVRLRRLVCPAHGVRTEAVPFARYRSDFTRDFEQLVAWLASRTDKTTITRLVRIHWRTVGRIIERVCTDELDPDRLDDLFEIGIVEPAPGAARVAEHSLGVGVGGDGVAHEPGEVGHQIGRARQPELVSKAEEHLRGPLDDGYGRRHVEALGVAVEEALLHRIPLREEFTIRVLER
jgi:hypothetical protein